MNKDTSGVTDLLNIVAKIEEITMRALPKQPNYRMAARLSRDPHDLGALSEAIVVGTKNGDPFFSNLTEVPRGMALLHCAIREVTKRLWEQMWNEAHPD